MIKDKGYQALNELSTCRINTHEGKIEVDSPNPIYEIHLPSDLVQVDSSFQVITND